MNEERTTRSSLSSDHASRLGPQVHLCHLLYYADCPESMQLYDYKNFKKTRTPTVAEIADCTALESFFALTSERRQDLQHS